MKRLTTLLIAILSMTLAFAQTNGSRTVYAELLGYQKGLMSNKITVTIDMGQEVSFWKNTDAKLVDENGKDIVFNSMVDAMNYMGQRGWTFVQAYVVTEGNQNVYHWLLSKVVDEDYEITNGINTKADFKRKPQTSYTITYMKRPSHRQDWDIVKKERRSGLSEDEVQALMTEWRNKSSESYIYECKVKKE